LISKFIKDSIMARGKNLKTPKKDAKALKQEKIQRKLEEKMNKKRKARI